MTDPESPVVLVVEDEPSVAEGYELWLRDTYDVRTAHDGREALEMVDGTVDVVLLDRMMPEMAGMEVLDEIRTRGVDCRVAMVTAVEPDFDVIEMGFDAYITKPPERAELKETVEKLLERAHVSDDLQEYHSLMARQGALQTVKSPKELEESDEYRTLTEQIEVKRSDVDEALGDMSSEIEFVSAVRELSNEGDAFEGEDILDGTELRESESEDERLEDGEPEGHP